MTPLGDIQTDSPGQIEERQRLRALLDGLERHRRKYSLVPLLKRLMR